MSKISFLIALCLAAGALAQPASTCTNIALNGLTYDLSWWSSHGPFVQREPTGAFNLTMSLCSPLPAPCINNVDRGTQACAAPGSAAVCQTWDNLDNPSRPNSVCAANANSIPRFESQQFDGKPAVQMTVGGGDDCPICTPETRETQFTIICDPTETPVFLYALTPDIPTPTYTVAVFHCTGCPTSDMRFCGRTSTADLDIKLQFVGASGAVALLPPPTSSTFEVTSISGTDLKIEGGLANALNETVNFLVSSGSSLAQGTISFPGTKVVALSLVDKLSGRQFPCGAGKAPRGASVTLACNMGATGAVVVSGSIL
eukprot:TRINITY_DN12615_c0_g1_i1.p1 TRINITY_DN12615_c0_g1~~TRINITY_DN12615_c0_g1_i1.p1  ORF type:complete len:315 (-),score=54.69 TRINITY_DN12615_c0_g1_i1:38-982(-)